LQVAVVLGITFLIVLIVVRILRLFSGKIKFYAAGLDQKFSMPEIASLWNLARLCDLEEPISLYYSVPALSRCITHIIEDAQDKGIQDTPKVQEFLSKLYKCHVEDLYVLKQVDFSDLQVRENTPEYGTYRTLVNHLLEGLADIEEGRVQNFEQAMKEIRKELEI